MRMTFEHYRDDWFERRKRLLLMGALRRPHYQRAFEPGCGFGNLTADLAQRCDNIAATDFDQATIARAWRFLAHRHNVHLSTMYVPRRWPSGRFDLIVLGDFLYYLPLEDIRRVAVLALQSLLPRGEIIACHWRHAVTETGVSGDEVHAELSKVLPLQFGLRHQEPDFILESWARDAEDEIASQAA
jgi:SAM-dependent methyltransferase